MSNTIATGSQRQLIYVPETTWGELPTDAGKVGGETPFKYLRNTGGGGIQVDRSSQTSEEFRADRGISELRLQSQRASLEVPFEFSFASFDDILEAALFGEWASDVLKQGTEEHSFSIEEGFKNIDVYLMMKGAMVNSFSLNFQPDGAMVTGTFNLLGKAQSDPVTSSEVYDEEDETDGLVPANTNPIFDSFKGHIKKDSQTLSVATSIEFTLNNNLEQLFALFDEQAFGMAVGRANLTGTLNAFFTGKDEIETFMNEDEFDLEIEAEDPSGNKYTFELPRVKFTGNTRNVSENQITQQMPFQALYDSDDSTIKITREEAVE